jgi:hypothetical protein
MIPNCLAPLGPEDIAPIVRPIDDQRILALWRRHRELGCEFVFAELELGLTFCQILRSLRVHAGPDYENAVQLAELALATAEKFMWSLRDQHYEFDQMTAQAERLRFELDALRDGLGA